MSRKRLLRFGFCATITVPEIIVDISYYNYHFPKTLPLITSGDLIIDLNEKWPE